MSDEWPAGQRQEDDDGPPDAAHVGAVAAIDGILPAEGAACSANAAGSAQGATTDETPARDVAAPTGPGRLPPETTGSWGPPDSKADPLSDGDAVTSSQDVRECEVNVSAPGSQSEEARSRASSTISRNLQQSPDLASAAGEEDSGDDRNRVESGDEQGRASEGPPRDALRPASERVNVSTLIDQLRLENRSLIVQIRDADQALSRALQLRQSEAAELKRRRRTATGPTRYPILAALAERAPPAAQARAHDTLQRHHAVVSRVDRLKEENGQLEGKRNGLFAHGDPRALANRVAELDGVLASLRDENRLLRQATGRQQSIDPSLAVSWERCANLERSVRQAKQEAASTAAQLASRRQAASQFWKHYWRVQDDVERSKEYKAALADSNGADPELADPALRPLFDRIRSERREHAVALEKTELASQFALSRAHEAVRDRTEAARRLQELKGACEDKLRELERRAVELKEKEQRLRAAIREWESRGAASSRAHAGPAAMVPTPPRERGSFHARTAVRGLAIKHRKLREQAVHPGSTAP